MVEALDDLTIPRDQYPNVVMFPQGTRQRARDLAETAGLDEIGHLGCCEEDTGLAMRTGSKGMVRVELIGLIRQAHQFIPASSGARV